MFSMSQRPSTPPRPRNSRPSNYQTDPREMQTDGVPCTVSNVKLRRAYLECERRNGSSQCEDLWSPHIRKETCKLSIKKRKKNKK